MVFRDFFFHPTVIKVYCNGVQVEPFVLEIGGRSRQNKLLFVTESQC